MDEQLAQIYGTNQSADDDLEKVAAAELLVKLAAENGINLDALSDQQVGELVTELYKAAEEAPPFPPAAEKKEEPKEEEKKEEKESPAEEKKEEEAKKEASEKVAEADFLGRVMAHSMVQELRTIEKQAGWAGAKEEMGRAISGIGKHDAPGAKMSLINRLKTVGAAAGQLPTAAKVVGGAAVAAGAAKGVHSIVKKIREKKEEPKQKAASVDELIQARAYEMAKQAGWVDAEGNLLAPQAEVSKEASAEQAMLDQAALQLLEANGYPVKWNG